MTKRHIFNPAAASLVNFCVLVLVAVMLPMVAKDANADYPQTPSDFSRLPRYCLVKIKKPTTSADYKLWERKIGPDFSHIHHYCAGLHTINLFHSSLDTNKKKYFANLALNEIGYVEAHATPKFFLRGELAVQKARLQSEIKDYSSAIGSYMSAIKFNPRYVPAYLGLSQLYITLGRPGDAKRVLNEGIKRAPNSEALRKLRDSMR